MTLAELQKLNRGDVVELEGALHETLGLVIRIEEVGPVVQWEDSPYMLGPYKTERDAARLTLRALTVVP